MAMGEAAGDRGGDGARGRRRARRVDVAKLQARLRAQGADPGDGPAANATFLKAAE